MAFQFSVTCRHRSISWKVEPSKGITRTDLRVRMGFSCDLQDVVALFGLIVKVLSIINGM